MSERPVFAVIGGSGLYAMEGLQNVKRVEVDTPFGSPSSPLILGDLNGRRMVFLARHGLNHTLLPSEVNYRANIFALKLFGVERILAVSACGSLREDYAPGDIVVPDQLFDHTTLRARTFFGEGLVAHVSIPDPFCPQLSPLLAQSAQDEGARVHRGGAYITIEGPRFSTRTESNTYRAWGMSIIGMTTSPEAFLAREAEMCYTVMAHVTDYDVWHLTEEPVTVERVVETFHHNIEIAQNTIARMAAVMPEGRACTCGQALQDALLTKPERIPPETRKKLAPLLDRILD